MDSIREIFATKVFELKANGIPTHGSEEVSISSFTDIGGGNFAIAGSTRGFINNMSIKRSLMIVVFLENMAKLISAQLAL